MFYPGLYAAFFHFFDRNGVTFLTCYGYMTKRITV